MAIGITLLDGNSSTTNATTYTTASITPAAGGVVLVITAMNGISVGTVHNTVSGLSGTWTEFNTFYGSGTATVQFSVHTCSNYSGTGVLTLGNTDSATNCLWSVVLLTGVDTTTPLVAGSFKTSTNASVTAESVTLNAAANANNRPFAAFCNNNTTAGQQAPTSVSWTELHDVAILTPGNTLETQWRSDTFDTAAGSTYSGGSYASSGIAFEINAASAVAGIISTATVRRRNAVTPPRKWIGQQSRSVTPVRAQVNPPWQPVAVRGLRRFLTPARRGHALVPVPVSQVVTAPAFVPTPPSRVRRLRGTSPRSRIVRPTQLDAPVLPTASTQLPRLRRVGRKRLSAVTGAPLAAQEVLSRLTTRRRISVPSGRRRAQGPTLTQTAVVANPSITATVFGRLRNVGRVQPRPKVKTPTPPQALRAIVPGYVYPTLGQWATWCTYPNQPAVLIANPGTGPGLSVNSDYTTWIGNAITAGIRLIGYVNLGYALRTLGTSADTAASNTVFGDVNGWLTFYPNVQGIFFDLPATDTANLAFTQSAITYARSKIQGGLIVINPGTYPLDSGYLDAADVTCVWEGDYSVNAYPSLTLPPWASYVPNYPPNKMAHIIRNVPDTLRERIVIAEALSFGVGWAYITDKLDYTDIPSYWAATERFDLWTEQTATDDGFARRLFARRSGSKDLPRRGKLPTVVPAQQAAIANPGITQTVFGRLRNVGRVQPRPKVKGPVPPQLNPPIVAAVFGRLRTVGRVKPRTPGAKNPTPSQGTPPTIFGRLRTTGRVKPRTSGANPVPAQQATLANPSITQTVFGRLRNVGRVQPRPKVRGPVPPQFNPPIVQTVFGRLRTTGRVKPRTPGANLVPAQQAAATNPGISQTVFGRLRNVGRVQPRPKVKGPVPPQLNPPIAQTVFGRLRNVDRVNGRVRRSKVKNPTPSQGIPPTGFGRLRSVGRVKPRTSGANPVPAQAVVNPRITQTVFGRMRLIGRQNRIPRAVKPIPAQVNPPYPVKPSRVVAFRGLSRRRGAPVSAPQVQPTAETRTIPAAGLRGLRRLWLKVRRKNVTPVPGQVTTLEGPLTYTDSHGGVEADRTAGTVIGGVYGSSSAATVKGGAAGAFTADPDRDDVVSKYDSDSDSL